MKNEKTLKKKSKQQQKETRSENVHGAEQHLYQNKSFCEKSLLENKFIFFLICLLSISLTIFTNKVVEISLAPTDYSSLKFSLFSEFAVDYEELSRERINNMRKYSYDYNVNGIDRRSELDLQEFYDVYDAKWPVIITDVVPAWPAFNWTRDFFHERYGQDRVAMKAVDKSLSNAVSLALPLHLFLKNINKASFRTWTYVEDELFISMRPKLHKDIGQNKYMNEDWFQLFPEDIRPWNAMLLWGTKFSRSSLHIDPYNWTGTNAVLSGLKRWKLYPPGQDHLLYVKKDKLSGFPLQCQKYNSDLDAFDPDLSKFPMSADAKSIEVDQYPGELLYIPTGWFHQAFNIEETVAISSQVMNRNNYRIVLEEIMRANKIRILLDKNIDQLSPYEQVVNFMDKIPRWILEHGRAVTKDALHQMAASRNEYTHNFYPDSLTP